jgi:hypothetical protein
VRGTGHITKGVHAIHPVLRSDLVHLDHEVAEKLWIDVGTEGAFRSDAVPIDEVAPPALESRTLNSVPHTDPQL